MTSFALIFSGLAAALLGLPLAPSNSTMTLAAESQPHTYGLSARQRQKLFDLTQGRVDLRQTRTADRLAPNSVNGNLVGASDVTPLAVIGRGGAVIGDARHFPEDEGGEENLQNVLSDREADDQWWVKALGADRAWGMATGRGITVADCDTGFYTDEPQIKSNLVLSARRDFADPFHPTTVNDGSLVFHGTAVAAIIAGVRDGRGTNGLAYDAKLVPLQNFNYDRSLDRLDKEEATARCVLGALRLPFVSVIVIENQTTFGSSETVAGTRAAVRLAVQSGVTVVSAAGNASLELQLEAADDTGSIIVGALRQNGGAANFSNFGERVTVSAFGENLTTLHGPHGQLDVFGGTTGAAAQVGAAVALMLSVNPQLSPQQVRSILKQTRQIDGTNRRVGGRLAIAAAVEQARLTPADRRLFAQAAKLRRAVLAVLNEENFQ